MELYAALSSVLRFSRTLESSSYATIHRTILKPVAESKVPSFSRIFAHRIRDPQLTLSGGSLIPLRPLLYHLFLSRNCYDWHCVPNTPSKVSTIPTVLKPIDYKKLSRVVEGLRSALGCIPCLHLESTQMTAMSVAGVVMGDCLLCVDRDMRRNSEYIRQQRRRQSNGFLARLKAGWKDIA